MKKTVNITFYTKEYEQLVQLFSPDTMNKFIPDWFKNLKNVPGMTMNNCPGFVDFLQSSIAIPLWSDFHITYHKETITNVVCPAAHDHMMGHDQLQQHDKQQWNNAYKNCCHVKLMSPWLAKCDTNIDFMMHDNTWHKEKQMGEYTLVPGILNFTYQPATAINMFLSPTEKPKTLTLEAGEPIAYLTPLGDVKLKVKTELVSHERWNQMLRHRFTFTNIMPKIKKFIMRRK